MKRREIDITWFPFYSGPPPEPDAPGITALKTAVTLAVLLAAILYLLCK